MKTKKKGTEPVLDKNGLTFEQAVERLEKIVADMEAAELPLEDVLKKYEEGTRLVRFCGQKLEEAEKKIEILTKKADGTVTQEPFESETDDGDDDKPEDEGGKLF
ncbi:MAG TPA: exodeoxyribonuclease VII small subunit [Verrucomicrobiae bacterium]|nr:exodeoxyribonuclease VII small subunit [Verrucomicrobiae bacterium]